MTSLPRADHASVGLCADATRDAPGELEAAPLQSELSLLIRPNHLAYCDTFVLRGGEASVSDGATHSGCLGTWKNVNLPLRGICFCLGHKSANWWCVSLTLDRAYFFARTNRSTCAVQVHHQLIPTFGCLPATLGAPSSSAPGSFFFLLRHFSGASSQPSGIQGIRIKWPRCLSPFPILPLCWAHT